jgi:Zn-dependent oligopeptidase
LGPAVSAPITVSTGLAGTFASCSFSDFRLKQGIKTLTGSLEKVIQFKAIEFDWNENIDPSDYEYYKTRNKLHSLGLIAQDVKIYFPEVVKIDNRGYYYIEYSKLNAVLVEAIKEQQLLIEDINEKILELEGKLN